MSRAVLHNNSTYLCGHAEKAITKQTETMLAKVDDRLTNVGSSRNKVLSATIYLKTMDGFQVS